MDLKKLVKPNIESLHAYHAEEIPCRVKLDANESPYGIRVLKSVYTNKYPDPEAKVLRRLIGKEFKVKPENVLHGNGSDELIQCLIATFGGPVLYPVPTFSMYGILSQVLDENIIEVPLDSRFDLDTDECIAMIKRRNPKLVFLSSPNNPTGNCFSENRILAIIRQSTGLVVVDEAYQPYSGKKSFVPMLGKHRNLVVLRTLSKIGLAGLRVGFMIAGRDIVNEVNKVRLPFNLNSLSQRVAVEALQDRKKMNAEIRLVIAERKRLYRAMDRMEGVLPYPSDANFILFKADYSEKIYRALLRKGILVRNMMGAVEGCLRVTVGRAKQNDIFLRVLKQCL